MSTTGPRRALLGLTLVTVLVAAACGEGDGSGSAPTADDLDGRTFVATSIEGADIVAGSEIVISFEEGRVIVQAGCNTQQSAYSIDDDGVLEAGPMAATLMACDDALMAQDQLVAEVVTSGPTLTLDGDELTIAGADTTITSTARN